MHPDLQAVFVIQKDGLAAITQGDSNGECIINSCNREPIPAAARSKACWEWGVRIPPRARMSVARKSCVVR
jgi:hypothetical protein